MTGFLGRIFNKPTILVLELDQFTKLPELTGDLRESLKTLEYHPGFQYLLQRLQVDEASLVAQFKEGLGMSEIQLRYLQAGIYWTGWLKNELKSLTTKRSNARTPTFNEIEEFNKINQNLQLVGV